MRKLAGFLMIAATLALMTTLVVLKAREPDTVRKIAQIGAKTYRLEGISKFRNDKISESEAAFARAIALNPDERVSSSGSSWRTGCETVSPAGI